MLDAKTLKQIERAVDKSCGKEEGEARDAGRVLLASAIVGPNAQKVAKALGIPLSRVSPYARRLRDNGIWTTNGKVAANWFNEEDGGVEFACDVNVALGFMERG